MTASIERENGVLPTRQTASDGGEIGCLVKGESNLGMLTHYVW